MLQLCVCVVLSWSSQSKHMVEITSITLGCVWSRWRPGFVSFVSSQPAACLEWLMGRSRCENTRQLWFYNPLERKMIRFPPSWLGSKLAEIGVITTLGIISIVLYCFGWMVRIDWLMGYEWLYGEVWYCIQAYCELIVVWGYRLCSLATTNFEVCHKEAAWATPVCFSRTGLSLKTICWLCIHGKWKKKNLYCSLCIATCMQFVCLAMHQEQ